MRDTKLEVLKFWFEETMPAQWFQKNLDFDEEIRARFLCTYEMVTKDLCHDWARDPDGILSLCIVLDQFPRNMFRNSPKAFGTDDKALLVAKDAIHKGFDIVLPPIKRRFVYLPFEHSEKLADQRKSVTLFETMKETDPLGYEYALKHHDVIEKFGRFPHRNAVLGRESSQEELEYLEKFGGF